MLLRPLLVLALLSAAVFPASEVWAATQCSTPGTAIPDNTPAGVNVSVPYQVGDVSSGIFDVNVSLGITHTWVGDLAATVSDPTGGATVQAFDRPGVPATTFGCGGDDLAVTFDDEAAAPNNTNIENVCGNLPAISGTYQPQDLAGNPLSQFDGLQPNGTWTFNVSDNANADIGTVDSACVTIQHAALTFDEWVSTNNTCSDTLDNLVVTPGTPVYYCFTVSNPGTEALVLNTGNASNDHGLSLSGLEGSYAAGASTTVVLGPYTAGGSQLPAGSTTDSSQVTVNGVAAPFDSTQTLTTSETTTVTVQNSVPSTGNKPLYLDTNTSLSRTAPASPINYSLTEGGINDWTLSPGLATALTVNAVVGGQLPVTLDLGETGPGSNRTFSLTVTSSDGTLNASGGPYTRNLNPTHTETYNLTISNSGTISAGSTITLRIQNSSTGNGNRRIIVAPNGSNANGSYVNLPSNTVINVDSVQFYDGAYPAGNAVPGVAPGQAAYVRAVISDPFGAFDVTAANVTMSGGCTPLAATSMSEIAALATAYSKTYELAIGTGGATNGSTCTASVTGYEGYEAPLGTPAQITHTNTGDLLVGTPNLTILKSAAGVSKPGQTLTYSIAVANTGSGYTNSLSLEDKLSPYVAFGLTALPPSSAPFTLSDGVPCGNTSGVTLGTPTYANDRPPTYAYVPPATGWDSAITAWRMQPLTGSMAPNSCFTLQYQVQVK